MPRFSDVDVFVAVANSRSLRRAAEELQVTKSTVSRALQRLEDHLGASLVVRDQRSMRLTEAGVAYQQFAEAAYRSLTEGEQAVATLADGVVGTLRVSAPPALGQALLARLCGEFLQNYPDVSIDLALTDRLVSLSGEPFDLVVRAGARLSDSDFKVRRMARTPIVAVAAKSVAASLERGARVPLVESAYPGRDPGDIPAPPVLMPSRFRVDDYLALKEALLAGHGVGVLSELLVFRELRDGRLSRVLADWQLPTASYWALFPGGGPIPTKTRVLLDYLVDGFTEWRTPTPGTETARGGR